MGNTKSLDVEEPYLIRYYLFMGEILDACRGSMNSNIPFDQLFLDKIMDHDSGTAIM